MKGKPTTTEIKEALALATMIKKEDFDMVLRDYDTNGMIGIDCWDLQDYGNWQSMSDNLEIIIDVLKRLVPPNSIDFIKA